MKKKVKKKGAVREPKSGRKGSNRKAAGSTRLAKGGNQPRSDE